MLMPTLAILLAVPGFATSRVFVFWCLRARVEAEETREYPGLPQSTRLGEQKDNFE